MIDTLRILVGWECNLRCPYCCNKIPEVRAQFREARLDDIDWSRYRTVCISGGEPLLQPDRILAVAQRVPRDVLIVLYTNGLLLDEEMGTRLWSYRVGAINVGLHIEATFDVIIRRVSWAARWWGDRLRFQARDCYTWLADLYPEVKFKFWKMNDCDRDNEDRVVLLPPGVKEGQ